MRPLVKPAFGIHVHEKDKDANQSAYTRNLISAYGVHCVYITSNIPH